MRRLSSISALCALVVLLFSSSTFADTPKTCKGHSTNFQEADVTTNKWLAPLCNKAKQHPMGTTKVKDEDEIFSLHESNSGDTLCCINTKTFCGGPTLMTSKLYECAAGAGDCVTPMNKKAEEVECNKHHTCCNKAAVASTECPSTMSHRGKACTPNPNPTIDDLESCDPGSVCYTDPSTQQSGCCAVQKGDKFGGLCSGGLPYILANGATSPTQCPPNSYQHKSGSVDRCCPNVYPKIVLGQLQKINQNRSMYQMSSYKDCKTDKDCGDTTKYFCSTALTVTTQSTKVDGSAGVCFERDMYLNKCSGGRGKWSYNKNAKKDGSDMDVKQLFCDRDEDCQTGHYCDTNLWKGGTHVCCDVGNNVPGASGPGSGSGGNRTGNGTAAAAQPRNIGGCPALNTLINTTQLSWPTGMAVMPVEVIASDDLKEFDKQCNLQQGGVACKADADFYRHCTDVGGHGRTRCCTYKTRDENSVCTAGTTLTSPPKICNSDSDCGDGTCTNNHCCEIVCNGGRTCSTGIPFLKTTACTGSCEEGLSCECNRCCPNPNQIGKEGGHYKLSKYNCKTTGDCKPIKDGDIYCHDNFCHLSPSSLSSTKCATNNDCKREMTTKCGLLSGDQKTKCESASKATVCVATRTNEKLCGFHGMKFVDYEPPTALKYSAIACGVLGVVCAIIAVCCFICYRSRHCFDKRKPHGSKKKH